MVPILGSMLIARRLFTGLDLTCCGGQMQRLTLSSKPRAKRTRTNPLYKNDHAQLLQAEHWFKQTYPEREAVRVSALPEAVAEEKATPAGKLRL